METKTASEKLESQNKSGDKIQRPRRPETSSLRTSHDVAREDAHRLEIRSLLSASIGPDLATLDQVMHAIKFGYMVSFGTFHQREFAMKTLGDGIRLSLHKGLPIGTFGWRRHAELDLNPAEKVNGVHGIVLTNDFTQAIIVIRGSDLPNQQEKCGKNSGCRSDLCADKWLFDMPPKVISTLPIWCNDGSAQHDYPAESAKFILQALKALPGHEVLLVGHSLGASLALIVAANPAISSNS